MVLACDLVVAAEDAVFGLPEVKRGLIAGSGGLLRLPRRILPASVAMEHALTGAPDLGGRRPPVGPGQPADAARARRSTAHWSWPARSPRTGRLAVRASKRPRHPGRGRRQSWRRQDALLAEVLASQDAREGAAAFVEKRPPVWTGA